jgi:hypothetical protein
MSNRSYRTLTIDEVEQRLERGLTMLASAQHALDSYDSAHIPAPSDVIAHYQHVADALSSFADEWGFDLSDVLPGDVSAMQ